MLATGAHPSAHGMVANLWFDRETGFTTYNVEDHRYRLLTQGAGDELVLDFAKRALVEEKLGADDITDYLSVNFSATDYVGHIFGPSSLEAEDNLRLFRTCTFISVET